MHLSTAMRAVCTVLARKKRASYTFSCQDILCEHLTGPSREKKYSYLVHYIYVCVIYIYTYICMYNVIYIYIFGHVTCTIFPYRDGAAECVSGLGIFYSYRFCGNMIPEVFFMKTLFWAILG